jgi:tyrosyl-tRNA synthetase
MSSQEFLGLTSLVSVQQVMQREDFRKRVDDPENPLTALEILYPVLQGYDSVMVKADVEIGGSDQLLNLHMGRRLQRRFDMPEQDVLTVPLIEGTDGVRKMSKSFGNAVILEARPEEMFAQTMTVADSLLVKYFMLLTDLSLEKIETINTELAAGKNPRDVKARLAWELVRMYHSSKEADLAASAFNRTFRDHEAPEEIPELKIKSPMPILDVLVAAKFVSSKSDARRVLEEGGVKVDGKVVEDTKFEVQAGSLIQKGKRHFVRIVRG